MKILVVSFGGGGDVHPIAAVGHALLKRGHDVCFISNPFFEPLARKLGLEFAGYGSAERFTPQARGTNGRFRETGQTRAFSVASWVARGIERWRVRKRSITDSMRWQYQFIEQQNVPGETVIVAHINALGARIAREKLGVPMVSVHLQPAVMRSLHDAPGLPLPNGDNLFLRSLRRLIWVSIDCCVDRIVTPEANIFRGELGLSPLRRPFNGWIHSPDLALGLFPDWFAPPLPDWPPNTHLVGFPLFDEGGLRDIPAELEAFLNSGTPPIVFTLGSFFRRARWFFEVSLEVCRLMNRRVLLLGHNQGFDMSDLPETVRHFSYVPYSAVLPRAAAIVHHGGIGTTALALAAGIPQLVVPFVDDQPDNAVRVRRLGAGLAMSRNSYRPKAVLRKLEFLLASREVNQACHAAAGRIRQHHPLAEVCRLIEELDAGG